MSVATDRSGWNEMRHAPSEGVLVLGMHRSGTSLVAGSLHLLGLAVSGRDDLITGMPWNPAGHWESRSLSQANDNLLAEMGRSWWYPPPAGAEYSEVSSRLVTTTDDAAAHFRRTYPSVPWVWKDPRLSLLLPFWRQALGESRAAVFVHRDPLEVARSLELRNGFPTSFGVALWARYNRLVLEHGRGLAMLVVRYDDLVEDPEEWIRSAESFLGALGPLARPKNTSDALAFVQPNLRHVGNGSSNGGATAPNRIAGTAETDLFLEVDRLVSTLRAQKGAHASFAPPALEAERPAVEAELSARWPDRPPVWKDPPWSGGPDRSVGGNDTD
jgi:hypothetical protein